MIRTLCIVLAAAMLASAAHAAAAQNKGSTRPVVAAGDHTAGDHTAGDIIHTTSRSQAVTTTLCESHSFRTRVCSVSPHRIERVLDVVRISSSPCHENFSYFIGPTSITVTRGCRAYFVYQSEPAPPTYTDINCSSYDYRPAVCNVPHSVQRVTLLRKYSRASCTNGSSYFRQPNGVRVTSGCRGKFRLFH